MIKHEIFVKYCDIVYELNGFECFLVKGLVKNFTYFRAWVRVSIVWVRECNDFDIGCKYVLSIVKAFYLGKNFIWDCKICVETCNGWQLL